MDRREIRRLAGLMVGFLGLCLQINCTGKPKGDQPVDEETRPDEGADPANPSARGTSGAPGTASASGTTSATSTTSKATAAAIDSTNSPGTGTGATPADTGEDATEEDSEADKAAADPDDEDEAEASGGEQSSAAKRKQRIDALLKQAGDLKTDDLEALGALARAKEEGASARSLARAANRRGERLYASPERATRFFEWANRADKRFPTPSFNLAKLAANRGELPQAKVHLREVAARGGKKLLGTLEFDPTFAVLADDPEVRRLWQQ